MQDILDKITFIASLPPIQSVIHVSGLGDGARVKLDVPQSEMAAILRLQLLAGQCFKITVEREDNNVTRSQTETY